MTWIKTTPYEQADESLKALYEQVYAHYPAYYQTSLPQLQNADGTSDSIVASHSLLPGVMHDIFAAHGRLLSPELPLSTRQHEMIATVVSSLNSCHY